LNDKRKKTVNGVKCLLSSIARLARWLIIAASATQIACRGPINSSSPSNGSRYRQPVDPTYAENCRLEKEFNEFIENWTDRQIAESTEYQGNAGKENE
jgi:hypothetical protein